MKSPLRETKPLFLVVAASLAVALVLLFAAPSGAVQDCYPSCSTTTTSATTTSDSGTKSTDTTTAVTNAATSTTAVAVVATSNDSGGGSLPVTGGDIVGMVVVGSAAIAFGGLFLATSKARRKIA